MDQKEEEVANYKHAEIKDIKCDVVVWQHTVKDEVFEGTLVLIKHEEVVLDECSVSGVSFNTVLAVKKDVPDEVSELPESKPSINISNNAVKIGESDNKKEIHTGDLVPIVNIKKINIFRRNFVCDACFEIFASKKRLESHKSLCENVSLMAKASPYERNSAIKSDNLTGIEKESTKSCEKCDFTTKYIMEFYKHKTFTHCDDKPFKCSQCNYMCFEKCTLKRHLKIHAPKKLLECNQCDYKCVLYIALKKHKKSHSDDKPFRCDSCSFKCRKSNGMLRHKRTHTGEKPHGCDQCDFKCARSNVLSQHKMLHTGEKPYKCQVCKATYRQASHLKTHSMIHTGEKPFKCDKCIFKCATKQTWKTHQLKYHSSNFFTCDICFFKFEIKEKLDSHRLKHIRNSPPKLAKK